jgi:hypothetical protein
MTLELCVCFDGDEMLFDCGIAGLVHRKPGDLLVPFLEMDWAGLSRQMDEAELSDDLFERSPFCTILRSRIAPLLWTCVVQPALSALPSIGPMHPMSFALMKSLRDRFEEMRKYQQCLLPMADAILLPEDGAATSVHRHFLFRQKNAWAYERIQSVYETVHIENRFAAGDQCYDFSEDADNSLMLKVSDTAPLRELHCYCTPDVKAVLLLEFEYLCSHRAHLRRCPECGKLFVPRPEDAQCCDRKGLDGKTCAERHRESEAAARKSGKHFFSRSHS